MSQLPERTGKKWNPAEETYVLQRIKAGVTPKIIAQECDRTSGAITSRLKKIACHLIDDGKSTSEVSDITGLDVNEILESLSSQSSPKNKQETVLTVVTEIRNMLRATSIAPPKKPGACYRCGRTGHYSPDCYARTHVKGYELD
jgi:hypothetical protein